MAEWCMRVPGATPKCKNQTQAIVEECNTLNEAIAAIEASFGAGAIEENPAAKKKLTALWESLKVVFCFIKTVCFMFCQSSKNIGYRGARRSQRSQGKRGHAFFQS